MKKLGILSLSDLHPRRHSNLKRGNGIGKPARKLSHTYLLNIRHKKEEVLWQHPIHNTSSLFFIRPSLILKH